MTEKKNSFSYTNERFADIQMLRYQLPEFEHLSLRQKTFIYHLSEAALAGRDILWNQNGKYNLEIRQMLETIYINAPEEIRAEKEFEEFEIYLKRVWFSNGIHHHYGCHKFLPKFSQDFLLRALRQAVAGQETSSYETKLRQQAEKLLPVIFDPQVMPLRVNQAEGEDLLLTSACNYYEEGITQAEAEAFYAEKKAQGDPDHPLMYGMNSKLERMSDGTLSENIWRIGGIYSEAISKICHHLEEATPYAENEKQVEVIRQLIEFYKKGDLKIFDTYTILWVQETNGEVDFTNGFTEVYGDPLGLKASWEGYVNYTDRIATHRAAILSENAQWFEDHSPIAPRFRKNVCRGVSARVVNAAMLGGDLYPSSAIGINLPNSNWVRAEYGSKSVTIGNLTHAYDEAAKGNGFREEFVVNKETLNRVNQYAAICDDLHTDLHECLGHGSGQLLSGVDPDALKAYGSTIEEARADLFALYYLADEKLQELGLTPTSNAYEAQYYTYLMNGLMTQMVRIEPGREIQEAHMRNRALISRWTLEHYPNAVRMVEQNGKHYVEITDYPALREAFGTLLSEIQRIKSEGDYESAKQLVETYGVHVEASLHQEVLERYAKLDLAPYKGFINPKLTPKQNEQREITDIIVSYDESYAEQMLRYSREYKTLL